MIKKYITIKQAAEILGINPMTLRRWDNKGKFKAFHHPLNHYRLYERSKIEKLYKKINP